MKYIDAEKLVEHLYKMLEKYPKNYQILVILEYIDSFQQEQPDFPTTDEEIERLLATHPKVEVHQKYKTPDWLWKKQEQPEVDLEKEVEKYLLDNADFVIKSTSNEMVNALARHFAEWGMNQCPLPEDTTIFQKGMAEGKRLMMDEAEECFVEWYDGLYLNLTTEQMSNAIERAGAKVGDKVRVIVIKEDK